MTSDCRVWLGDREIQRQYTGCSVYVSLTLDGEPTRFLVVKLQEATFNDAEITDWSWLPAVVDDRHPAKRAPRRAIPRHEYAEITSFGKMYINDKPVKVYVDGVGPEVMLSSSGGKGVHGWERHPLIDILEATWGDDVDWDRWSTYFDRLFR
jgi:hypothetical protein